LRIPSSEKAQFSPALGIFYEAQLPNGTHYEPVGKRDGSVNIKVRVNYEVNKKVNNNFRGKWTNAANKGVSEADIFEQ
jgi:hypothetical protein